MDNYGTAHLAAMTLFVVGLPVAAMLGRWELRHDSRTVSRTVAVAIPLVHVPTQVVDVVTRFEVGVSLPLHLSDLAWIATAVALWTHHRHAVALTYFWGLVLTTQAIVTPSLGEDFPDLRFFAYWVIHLVIPWAAVFLVWGRRLPPAWRDYRFTLLVTATWAVAAYCFNAVADTNYGYLQRKPSNGSFLDLLGPWPVYVLAEIAIVAAIWALMTWPWARHPADPSLISDGSPPPPR
ncbi:TIGR02206 family membrane protein [Nocardioides dongxiaopingii]|uniref:YwaF family protein n=1 Tax=Nocardioides sp. S-1144 TaxID=2582905 RepID=UPI00110D7C38|nr:TIGR02206 family membrane protein [Nocardioides sp. S-1144]QCW50662.1 TIGR02206 family membrane protein [Nocardioides sp. S-1144]